MSRRRPYTLLLTEESDMKASKKIAFSSILTAVSVILMLIGSFFGSLDLTAAALASFCVIMAVAELGYKSAAAVYAAASLLAMLLLPSKTPAVYFMAFFGYYPIVKSLSERLSRVISYVIKYLSFSLSYVALAVVAVKFFPEAEMSKYVFIGYFVCAAVLFIYDLALTRIIGFYCSSLRKRLGIDKLFRDK